MKKLLMLILVLSMVFSLVACKSECEKKGHLDEDKNGVCDRCEENYDGPHNIHADENTDGRCDGCESIMIDYSKPNIVGTILRKSLEKQFHTTQSFQFEFEFEVVHSDSAWESEDDVFTQIETENIDKRKVELWVNRNGDSFDLKIITDYYTFHSEISSDGDYYDYENDYGSLVYVIDGYIYTELVDDTFKKEKFTTNKLDEILLELSSAEILSKDKKDALLNALGAEVATVLNLKDNKGSMSINLKDGVDELLAYIAALDFETDTVGKVLNDALTTISKDLTVEDIITELERVSNLTINEALSELDAWLTENHSTTVQGVIDSLVGSPELLKTLEEILLMVNNADPSDTELQETIAGMIEQFKNFNLANFIAENELGELTVYELVASMVDGTMPARDAFFTSIKAMMDMTLAEFDENIANGAVSNLQKMASMISVDSLNAMIDVKLENVLELSELSGSFNIGFTITTPSEYEGKTNTNSTFASGSLKLYEISNNPIVIALSEDAEIISSDLIDGEFVSGDSYLHFDSYASDDGIYIDVEGEYFDPEIGNVITFNRWSVPLRRIVDDVIILDDVRLMFNGTELEIDGPDVMKLTVDPENHTFTIVSMPNYITPSKAYIAFLELAYNNFYGEPTNGYSMVDGAVPNGFDPSDICIDFTDYPLSFIYFSVAEGDDENTLICTLTGFGNKSSHPIYHPTNGTTGYGGYYYDSNPEAFNLFFGGDLTFEIVFDPETGVFSFVEYPMIEEMYQKEWPQ